MANKSKWTIDEKWAFAFGIFSLLAGIAYILTDVPVYGFFGLLYAIRYAEHNIKVFIEKGRY